MTERLVSWTRTLNEEDAIALLLAAHPGQALASWKTHGHESLPQAKRGRRLETLRIVRESLLDLDGEVIADTAWLRLFRDGSPERRHNLLYGRYCSRRPWILRAVDELILPALARADEPLAPEDADVIPNEVWEDFFDRNLRETTPAQAAQKTRWHVPKNLARLGVLTIEGRPGTTRVCHGEPDPIAFGWLVAHELRLEGRAEALVSWAATASVAARIFAARRAYAEHCVEIAVSAGLLTPGCLAGIPRLVVTEER